MFLIHTLTDDKGHTHHALIEALKDLIIIYIYYYYYEALESGPRRRKCPFAL